MAKKKRKSRAAPEEPGLPPEGLWISPSGDAIPVIEHLIEIQQNPEPFGLAPKDVERRSIKDLRQIARSLIQDGWTRFRYLSGTWNFEVDQAKLRISLIQEVLVQGKAYPEERVVIAQLSPKRDYQGTVAEFYDRSMFRHYELGGNRWRLT